MAYSWQTDPNPNESHEKQYEHQEFLFVNQPHSSSQVSLGFDQIVDEISGKIPHYESEIDEDTFFVPIAPKWDSKGHSLNEAHQISLNEFTSKSRELSWHQVRKAPAIGFSPSVLPKPQNMNKECPWGSPRGKHHGADDSRFNILAPSFTSLDKINLQKELENENRNYPIGFESSIPPTNSSFSTDFMPKEENKRSGHVNIVEPSLMLLKGSLQPRMGESAWQKNIESIGCSIQLVEVPQGSNTSLASFCNNVKKIRERYDAADINFNSGKIWSTTTAFPYQLFSKTKFNIHIFIDNSTQPLHFMPCANYLVKDLIAKILHFCTNDQLLPKDHILNVCGSEEFLQNDHSLGSHKMFQKDKSVIQLHLQKSREAPGKLSRKHEEDHSQFYLNQLLEFMHIWKVSRQCLLTVIKKYDFHLKYLLKTQENVDNIIEEVKKICSVLGCVETKQITDAVNELSLILQRKAENFYQSSETSAKGLIEKVTTELSTSIYQLVNVYCNSFYADFQPVNVPRCISYLNPGLPSHLSFTVYAAHNIPETWVHSYKAFSFTCWLTYAGKKLCQVRNYRNIPVKKLFFFLVNWNETINFPLEIKSLPRESMLTVKLFGIACATNNANLLAWTCLPLFPKEKSILGSMLFSMTLQSEPPVEMIAPGVWDVSQPSPVTLQIDFPATGWEYVKPDSEENGSNLEEPPKECLKHIARLSQKQTPLLLSEEKKRYLWFYRFYCNNENCSLPLVLGSAPGWDERTVSEMHTILRRWTFSQPLEALGLLTSSFTDQEIRKVAVQQLDTLLNDELLEYLPQLVQAVKFEWNLESPLVQLLLHRSLQSIQVAHRLYWLLKDAENEAYFKSWYQKLLAALQFCAGKALSDEFSKEQKLIKILGDIGEKVKSANDHQRQEVLKKEIGRLEEFFQDVNTCHLPLNPALCIKGIDHDACSYFTSNALPLKITFINANPMGKNISLIFKAGDDLRQDMLVLQIIQVMDNIWLQEGLDMQMIIYRCLSTGKDQGLVQMVPDAVTLAKIHRHSGLIGPLKENTIKKWFSQHNHLKTDYEKALRNFFYSCAGWCVVTFILGVCDRHNDNIMLTKSGHMFHIDFGKFLGHAQTFGGIKRDRAPFIFTSEMEYFITEGGKNPQHFQDFVELCCRAYNIIRKHSQLLLNLLEMMLYAGLPELSGIQDLKYVYNNLRPQDTDLEATSHFTKKIKESLECFPVKLNNLIHTLAQMSAISPAKSTSQTFPQESCLLSTTRLIQTATILGFSKKSSNLYLIQVTHSNNETSLIEKSFDQFSKLHSQLQKQFASLTLPEFPHWWHLPFTNSDHKRFGDLNHYMEQILNGSCEVTNSDCVLSFFLSEAVQQTVEESSLVYLGEKFPDKKPKVQLVISYEDVKLTILVKHMKNIHLPDGSAPSAHVEFYLLPYPSEVRRRKTKSVPKCTDPTYNEIVVYDEVTELQGHVLMLIVKSKTVFVGAINIQLCSVPLDEEKWYPLGNSII
ncbi:phosphatidylinositol 3-kinase C2 domain-containing subunit gamma isoform X1 [Macaca thibetana thibetana]|uniref:phosphatidylinositol 3-kinase C2 domain-containing subunit gamma isoform X1 n=1 Tax=Macaca thibetana thibetana TaxID=257877 RepID=UPI0021BCBEF5|nr:phosphatidylinositol 3-kinase C2 domain-containing subunit gamma isoform X1 [Macaca thibetana thibetana]XP_050606010.1 phosphatidylinositol 3-kinase C2 domain-containing subunit gamma isoform X1 [Macaca thibetana thibetana]XP_050606011.1 phosphatidylinositol 3-kinase C2 domain-containing subunit gamma isoform X1 [Macaca thibetana thibetana]